MSTITKELTTVNKVNLLLGSLPMAFNCMCGEKLNTMLRYQMEVTTTQPYTLTVSQLASKTVSGSKVAVRNELIRLTAQNESIKISVLNDLPLTSKECFKTYVDDEEYQFTSHREIVQLLALPYWIDRAKSYVSTNNSAPMWLVISYLIQRTQKVDGNALHETQTVLPFTVDQFNDSLRDAAKALPDNPQLANAVKALNASLTTKTTETKVISEEKVNKQ